MNDQDLINTCIFEQIQGLLFSDLSGPLRLFMKLYLIKIRAAIHLRVNVSVYKYIVQFRIIPK